MGGARSCRRRASALEDRRVEAVSRGLAARHRHSHKARRVRRHGCHGSGLCSGRSVCALAAAAASTCTPRPRRQEALSRPAEPESGRARSDSALGALTGPTGVPCHRRGLRQVPAPPHNLSLAARTCTTKARANVLHRPAFGGRTSGATNDCGVIAATRLCECSGRDNHRTRRE